jgi:hypothetical protein
MSFLLLVCCHYFEFGATNFDKSTWRCQYWKAKALLDKSIIVTNKTGWMLYWQQDREAKQTAKCHSV